MPSLAKFSTGKLSRLSKNHKSFPPRLFCHIRYNEMGKLIDLPQRTHPRKVNNVMRAYLNQALSENDELTARGAYNLLSQQWPTLQVSLSTIK